MYAKVMMSVLFVMSTITGGATEVIEEMMVRGSSNKTFFPLQTMRLGEEGCEIFFDSKTSCNLIDGKLVIKFSMAPVSKTRILVTI